MKLLIVIFVLVSSFFVGYLYKHSIHCKLGLYIFLKDYIYFLKTNINMYKVSVVEITDEFLMNNKNANQYDIFEKNNKIVDISNKKLNKILNNEQEVMIISNFFKMLGTNEYVFEIKKIENFEAYICDSISKYSFEEKNKGSLFFKIALSVGAVVAILIW